MRNSYQEKKKSDTWSQNMPLSLKTDKQSQTEPRVYTLTIERSKKSCFYSKKA